jgi:hypothetical protein
MIVVLLLVIVLFLLVVRRNPAIHSVPGPWKLAPWGNYFDMLSMKFGCKMSQRFGQVYSVWFGAQPVVVVASAEAAKQFYKTQSDNYRDWSNFPYPFPEILGSCLGAQCGDK